MSISFCVFCQKKHDDFAWKTIDYEENGVKKWGWFCRKAFKPSPDPERIPERIKDDRKAFAKSMLQPFREGEPSREFIEAYPDQARKTFTPKEIANAKNVWKDVIGSHWQNSR
jgi:hypothetical protein